VGCHQGLLRSTPQHICLFARDGFTQDDRFFVPCGTTYHIGCIRVGEPFRTRLPAGRGLAYPKVAISPSFICEAYMHTDSTSTESANRHPDFH
jgi:hypothetical protein